MSAGNFDCQVSITGEHEFATLARAFNVATAHLRDLYEALQRSEAYFRSLIENVGDPIFVMDESGTLFYALQVCGFPSCSRFVVNSSWIGLAPGQRTE